MSRFRFVVLAAIVGIVAYSLLHHGQKWTTYHDARDGWTIDLPRSFHHREVKRAVMLSNVARTVPASGLAVWIIHYPGRDPSSDSQVPLDPVELRAARGHPFPLGLHVVSSHRSFSVLVYTRGARWQSTYFRMIRSLRFS